MDHPNIAKVLDAGTTGAEGAESQISNLKSEISRGRPYFVMELVRGIKITDYCDLNHLSAQERLDLFIQVCHAIQHAYQKGIIHRDIKPSNILVTLHDGVPVPKVIDFGIAKATEGRLTEATVYTQLHQFIGTPAYMSPEQAEMSGLDIDTRSDIYSLGVLLYELLTGRTPFDARELMAMGLDAMRRTIREKEPVRPSTRLTQELVAATRKGAADSGGEYGGALTSRHKSQISNLRSQIPEDLDWIVMKCLEKDRARRYETANGLAADIHHHLNHEPVELVQRLTENRTRRSERQSKGRIMKRHLARFVMPARPAQVQRDRPLRILALLFSILLVHAQPVSADPPYTALYVFGDSWSGTTDGPYWRSRWSNGPDVAGDALHQLGAVLRRGA